MKRTKKLLSFFLAIMMVITTIPAFSITASAATINDLETLISSVEKLGIGMSHATNLKNLYTAYVSACKAYDSYYYGKNTDTDITKAYNNLNTAYKACGSWTAGIDKGVTPGGFHNDNGGTYKQGEDYRNLLYNPRVVDNSTSKVANRIFIQDQGVDLEIYYGANTVVYYDGTNNKPMIPVFMLGGRTVDSGRNLYTLYPCDESNRSLLTSGKYDWTNTSTAPNKSSVFVMKDKWYGRNGGNYNDMNYFAGIVNKKSRVSIDNISFTSSDNHSFDGRYYGTRYNQFCNVLVYNTTPTNAIDKCSIVWFKATGGTGADDRYLKSTNDKSAEIYIYVVNYAGILSQINEKSNLFVNLSKYKEDTGNEMSTALGYYDTLTSYTYSKIDYSSNIDSLKSTLDTAYNGIKAIKPTQDDQNGYPAIRSAMDRSMAIFDGNNSDGKYTANSYEAFKTAYTTAKNVMSSVATVGYNAPFTNAATIATNLNNAFTHLEERADFSQLESNYNTAQSKIADELRYTKSSLEALKTVVNNTVYAKYSDDTKANTAKTTSTQNSINSESKAIADAIKALENRANFSAYNQAIYTATVTDGYLNAYTSSDCDILPIYTALQAYEGINTFSDTSDIGVSRQNEVYNVTTAIGNANSTLFNSTPIQQEALKAFIKQNFDLDVVNNDNIKAQKKSAEGLYETVTFNGTIYYSLDVENKEDLDAKLRGYINSINSTLGEYDIKVPENADIKVTAGGVERTADSIAKGFKTYKLTYGVPVTFTSKNADTAWYMEYESKVAKRGVQYQCSGETYATKVMGNMTVTPKSSSNSNTPHKVTVVRQYSDGSNTAMLIDYVGAKDTFTLPTVQTYPNYTFERYELAAGSNATIENGTVTGITGDTVIYAKYTALGNDCAITITKTDGTTTTENYKYNSAVSLNDPNAYAWIEKPIGSNTTWRPSYIGTGCSYKVTEPMELKAVATVDEMKQLCGTKEAYAPNLRYNGPLVANGMGVVFHGQFINYVPEGAQIVEYGVAVNINNANSFDLINTNGKVIRCKSTNPMKSNQFSVGARYNGDTFTSRTAISYRSYMIYQITVNNQLETRYAYSDVRTFNPNPNA